jgi:hypothetical protein
LSSWLARLWVRLTYWRVPCETCKGTGLCEGTLAGGPPSMPHSCCGDCGRRWVPRETLPAGFDGNERPGQALIGNGVMFRRPWSRRQTERP